MQQNVTNSSLTSLPSYPLSPTTNLPPPPSHFFQFQKSINQLAPQHRAQHNRVMYKSTIQPTAVGGQASTGFGLGRLETMGRSIRQQSDQLPKMANNPTVFQPQLPRPLAFRGDRPQRAKMASSVIFFNKNNEQNGQVLSFIPSGNVPSKGLQSLVSRARNVKEEIYVSQTSEEKKQREIVQIKRQLEQLNQKMGVSGKVGGNVIENQICNGGEQFNLSGVADKSKHEYFQLKISNNGNSTADRSQLNLPAANSASSVGQVSNPTDKLNENKQIFKKYSNSESTSGSSVRDLPAEGEGMFKKKNPYGSSNQNGKTDQNLLKMLGIHIKPAPEQPLVPKSAQNMSNPPKYPIKLEQPPYQFPKSFSQTTPTKPSVAASSQPRKFRREDFKIGKKMGKGQFGEVMLVQHKLTGFLCGMKVMSKKQIREQKYSNQIARELSIQFYLSHRNIAPLYGYFQDSENIYLLVQFCTDGQLLELIRKNRRMEEAQVSPIIRQICEGLDYIHKEEIIHRDIKPQNILFNLGTVKVSDFGWAVYSANGLRKTISGSPLYYSPEIVLETSYDEKIDLWAIGMMTYECLLGKIPFRIYSQLDLNRIVEDEIKFPEYVDVSDEAKDFILRIMKKKPEERMELKEIMRHPFITKYARERKVAPQVIQEIRKTLSL